MDEGGDLRSAALEKDLIEAPLEGFRQHGGWVLILMTDD